MAALVPAQPKVFILNNNISVDNMFVRHGWLPTDHIQDADLIQFTGGADVSPIWYGEKAHRTSRPSPERDAKEMLVFTWAKDNRVPMAGICRGAQFLNVMCGGSLWQDVDGHRVCHEAIDEETGDVFMVTSTHHQMMRPAPKAEVFLTAAQSKTKERMDNTIIRALTSSEPLGDDVEGVWYNHEECLCFQPHPEYIVKDAKAGRNTDWSGRYFDYIFKYFDMRGRS
jgi:gamma-glutamyl-gamma-aminobutyrate hydrolase PuuD